MRKIMVTLIVVSILSVTIAAPVFAHGWGGHSREGGEGVNLLWPITAALVLPAAILGGVVHLVVQEPARYAYVPPPVPVEPEMYSGADTYYAPRVYAAPPDYYAPRAYYPARGHRGCW